MFGTTQPGGMQEPIEVIDYSSDEDFARDGDVGSEGPSFASSTQREQGILKVVAI